MTPLNTSPDPVSTNIGFTNPPPLELTAEESVQQESPVLATSNLKDRLISRKEPDGFSIVVSRFFNEGEVPAYLPESNKLLKESAVPIRRTRSVSPQPRSQSLAALIRSRIASDDLALSTRPPNLYPRREAAGQAHYVRSARVPKIEERQ